MRDFRWVSGQVAEVQRFINVPRRRCDQYPARERRELWITADQGPEFKFVVHTTLMPARRGYRVLALLMGRELVALHNLQTGESVNYLRSDPPLLWRRCEAVAAMLAAGGRHRGVRIGRRCHASGGGRGHSDRCAWSGGYAVAGTAPGPACDRPRADRRSAPCSGASAPLASTATREVAGRAGAPLAYFRHAFHPRQRPPFRQIAAAPNRSAPDRIAEGADPTGSGASCPDPERVRARECHGCR
jgi:hypothetical protein